MIKIKKAKLVKMGRTYLFIVPKKLIDCEVLSIDRKYDIELHDAPIVYSGIFNQEILHFSRILDKNLGKCVM